MIGRLAAVLLLACCALPAAAASEPDADQTALGLSARYGFDPGHIAGVIRKGQGIRPFADVIARLLVFRGERFEPARHAPGSPCRRLNTPSADVEAGFLQWRCNPGGAAEWGEATYTVDPDGTLLAVELVAPWPVVADVVRPDRSAISDRQWSDYVAMMRDALTAGFTIAAPASVRFTSRGADLVATVDLP